MSSIHFSAATAIQWRQCTLCSVSSLLKHCCHDYKKVIILLFTRDSRSVITTVARVLPQVKIFGKKKKNLTGIINSVIKIIPLKDFENGIHRMVRNENK